MFRKGNNEEANKFDERVSAHMFIIDARFTRATLKELRQLRNRCAHPNAHLGHLSPEDLIAVRQIKGSLQIIELLARLSLDNPPI